MAILNYLILAAAANTACIMPVLADHKPSDEMKYVRGYKIKHITIPCKSDYPIVRKAIEAAIPPMNNTYMALLHAETRKARSPHCRLPRRSTALLSRPEVLAASCRSRVRRGDKACSTRSAIR